MEKINIFGHLMGQNSQEIPDLDISELHQNWEAIRRMIFYVVFVSYGSVSHFN